jgi:hypothetical protein
MEHVYQTKPVEGVWLSRRQQRNCERNGYFDKHTDCKGKEPVTRGELETFVKDALVDNSNKTLTQIKHNIRNEVREDIRGKQHEFKQDIVVAAQTYTDNLTEKLKLELDTKFETIMRTLNLTL